MSPQESTPPPLYLQQVGRRVDKLHIKVVSVRAMIHFRPSPYGYALQGCCMPATTNTSLARLGSPSKTCQETIIKYKEGAYCAGVILTPNYAKS